MANISIDGLAAEIAEMLAEYSQDVVEKVNLSSEKVGKAAVKQLKQTSPKDSGDYAKSWKMTTNAVFGQPSNRIIHVAAPHYRLTHLLEHGHAKRGGGRVEGKPHIRPAEQQVIEEFTREVEEAIRNGAG
ncbi:Bacteriophage HK97-gp10, putative tail-component [Desulfitobacterium hafniense]|uniref:Bacteriophage HK97-gp10, putative tail-component n=1 Tax=Desulfitobacterium hafniense TaxID=49338 RepID=A0A098AU88_DESHA|nr:HK97 gp10 family phage protein [Desulfitobacterium hafniense]CDV96354.1 Bacteriophage HK97-gp10, putative tail-component [Desulfitobacterium hafniense]